MTGKVKLVLQFQVCVENSPQLLVLHDIVYLTEILIFWLNESRFIIEHSHT